MKDKFYESLNYGFNNMIKSILRESLLNEKKQEISPEDQKDNELIRSAMKKRVTGRANARFTKEEADALKRNGWTSEGDEDRTFKTANGEISFGNPKNIWGNAYENPNIYNKSHEVNSNARATDKTENNYVGWGQGDNGGPWKTTVHPANINLADMGRKQQERAENRPSYYVSERTRRGAKKNSSPNKNGNTRNRLSAERFDLNYKLFQDYRKVRDLLDSKKRFMKYGDGEYDRSDDRRREYLDKIAYYKQLLSELDSTADERANRYYDQAKLYGKGIEDILNKKRERLNKTKSESLNRVHRKRIAESKKTSKGKRV